MIAIMVLIAIISVLSPFLIYWVVKFHKEIGGLR